MIYTLRHRKEFPKSVKREALARSGQRCEAEGPFYNRDDRCNADLGYGVQFDHMDAMKNDDNSLENCRAICIPCHKAKTPQDTTNHAKVKRQSDKHHGIRKPSFRPLPGTKASGIRKKFNGTVEYR